LAIALMAFGAVLILGLESWGRKLSQQPDSKEFAPEKTSPTER
jgi:hypothetical protein